jgi:hypothetical protein
MPKRRTSPVAQALQQHIGVRLQRPEDGVLKHQKQEQELRLAQARHLKTSRPRKSK